MPWITTKTGKRINTDWFADEDKKQMQIKRNQEQAKTLNKPVDDLDTDSDIPPAIRMSNLLAKKGVSGEEEIANYLRNLSPTRKSRLAAEMGIGGRGDERIRAMAHAIYLAGKNDNEPASKPISLVKEENPANKKAEKIDFPQQYKEVLGEKKNVDAITQLTKCQEGKYINPNWKDYRTLTPAEQKKNKVYHNNCALCTTAIALQARGYDVEAMPRDKTWRGCETVFDFDINNPDNFLIGNARDVWDNYRTTRECIRHEPALQVLGRSYQRMPQGASAAALAIIKKSQEWGHGSVAELSVQWKNRKSGHSVSLINQNGIVFIYDGQNNRTIIGRESIEKYLKRTIASRTELIRLDNAPLKSNVAKELEMMVKVRDTSVRSQLDVAMDNIDWDKF